MWWKDALEPAAGPPKVAEIWQQQRDRQADHRERERHAAVADAQQGEQREHQSDAGKNR